MHKKLPDFFANGNGGRFRRALLAWYDRNQRDLPWRRTRDPYPIWLSEIMLQQTRVAAVLEHYRIFLQRFPNIGALAEASEDAVLAAWSGLGYYRRARMLHRCAQEIVGQHGGRFPQFAADLRELPGIGRYTAAAIASIAFGEAVAVVDGNVERVLQRVGGREIDCHPELGSRTRIAIGIPARRFQPGHDGAGGDCVSAARTAVRRVSGTCSVYDSGPGTGAERIRILRARI